MDFQQLLRVQPLVGSGTQCWEQDARPEGGQGEQLSAGILQELGIPLLAVQETHGSMSRSLPWDGLLHPIPWDTPSPSCRTPALLCFPAGHSTSRIEGEPRGSLSPSQKNCPEHPQPATDDMPPGHGLGDLQLQALTDT